MSVLPRHTLIARNNVYWPSPQGTWHSKLGSILQLCQDTDTPLNAHFFFLILHLLVPLPGNTFSLNLYICEVTIFFIYRLVVCVVFLFYSLTFSYVNMPSLGPLHSFSTLFLPATPVATLFPNYPSPTSISFLDKTTLIALQWGVGPHKPLPHCNEVVTAGTLCKSSAGNYSRSEFVNTAGWCSEDTLPQHFSPASGTYILSIASSMMFPEPRGWKREIEMLHLEQRFQSHWFSTLWAVLSLCINHCPLQEEEQLLWCRFWAALTPGHSRLWHLKSAFWPLTLILLIWFNLLILSSSFSFTENGLFFSMQYILIMVSHLSTPPSSFPFLSPPDPFSLFLSLFKKQTDI